MRRIVATRLPPEASDTPLAVYLSRRFTYHTEADWEALIAAGRVVVTGDLLEYFPEERPEPPVSTDVRLLHEDADYLGLDKPANLPCHPAGAYFNHTLWACLKEGRLNGIPPMADVRFVNRLDRETSGIVLLAKSARAASRAARSLKTASSCKRYHVLVEGNFPSEYYASGFLYRDPNSRVNKKMAFSRNAAEGGFPVETRFRTVRSEGGLSLVEATLGTGRTHQIRATLCSLGYPVVGDKLYGVDETLFLRFISHALTLEDWRRLRLPNQALHASCLEFDQYRFLSPVPEEWPLRP